MKKILIGSLLFALTTGCATTGIYRPLGPAAIQSYTDPITATHIEGTKTGHACASNVLGIVSAGDASIDAAKKEGGITQVASVDMQVLNVFFLFGKICTIVKGQ